MDDRHAQVVDPLVADEVVGVPEGVEDFAGRDGGDGVLADEAEGFLIFCGGGVLHPEEVMGFELFAEAGWAVVYVVEEMQVVADGFADRVEELGGEVEIALCGPEALAGEAAFGGFGGLVAFGDGRGGGYAGEVAFD